MMSKVDNVAKEKRIRSVQEWILEDWPTVDILNLIVNKWGIQERQAKRYISEAKKRWISEEDLLIQNKRRLKVQTLKKLKRSLSAKYIGTPRGIQSVLNVEKEIIKLENLIPPRKIELSGPDGNPIQTENSQVVLYLPSNGRDDAEEGD